MPSCRQTGKPAGTSLTVALAARKCTAAGRRVAKNGTRRSKYLQHPVCKKLSMEAPKFGEDHHALGTGGL